jgi:diguanylate cyclase (GGDEF)-like protein
MKRDKGAEAATERTATGVLRPVAEVRVGRLPAVLRVGRGADEPGWRWRGLVRAERVVAPLRGAVAVANLVAWLLLPRPAGAQPSAVWALAVLAVARAVFELVLVFRRPDLVARSPKVSPLLDLGFILAWLAATGGPTSPFGPLLFAGLAGPLRLPPAAALVSLALYTLAGALLLGRGQLLLLLYFVIVAVGLYGWVLKTQEERWRADTDGLTELFNHRYLKEHLVAELRQAAGRGACGAWLFLDLDRFKLFNDTYGHPAGDEALRDVAAHLRRACPRGGILGRFGGDEFALLWPGADRAGAGEAAERLRQAVAAIDLRSEQRVSIPLTVSVGVALYPQDGSTEAELLAAADKALYVAKRSGGNTVAFADSEVHRLIATYGPTLGALESLAIAVEYKDHNTAGHTDYVARLCALLGERLGLSDEERRQLRIGAVLHDVGKIGIPDEILLKPGPLTPEELEVMRRHPELGYMILKEVQGIDQVLDIVLHHHERYDGRGYPHGLKGEEIRLATRIVSVVDAYTAMTSDRPYRKALTPRAAVAEILRHAGSQFDPRVAAAFVDLLRELGGAG